jgi:hypothetical protein
MTPTAADGSFVTGKRRQLHDLSADATERTAAVIASCGLSGCTDPPAHSIDLLRLFERHPAH